MGQLGSSDQGPPPLGRVAGVSWMIDGVVLEPCEIHPKDRILARNQKGRDRIMDEQKKNLMRSYEKDLGPWIEGDFPYDILVDIYAFDPEANVSFFDVADYLEEKFPAISKGRKKYENQPKHSQGDQ